MTLDTWANCPKLHVTIGLNKAKTLIMPKKLLVYRDWCNLKFYGIYKYEPISLLPGSGSCLYKGVKPTKTKVTWCFTFAQDEHMAQFLEFARAETKGNMSGIEVISGAHIAINPVKEISMSPEWLPLNPLSQVSLKDLKEELARREKQVQEAALLSLFSSGYCLANVQFSDDYTKVGLHFANNDIVTIAVTPDGKLQFQ